MDTKSIGTRFTLGKNERLKSRKLIGQLFSDGRSVSAFPIKMLYLFTPGSSSLQAGFTASSKFFKKAVDRNRIKRLMREAYRTQKNELNKPDIKIILFFIYTGKEIFDLVTAREKMKILLNKLNELLK